MKTNYNFVQQTLPVVILLFCCSINAFSQIDVFKKMLSEKGQSDNKPNYSIAMSGNSAIVGFFLESTDSIAQHGIAYIFERNKKGSWIKKQKLVPNDLNSFDNFGISVAISGNYALIGSLGHDLATNDTTITDAGAAYFYEKQEDGNWVEVQKVLPSDAKPFFIFGNYVSLSGEYAIINSLNEKRNNTVLQSPTNWVSYIFQREENGQWQEIKKLVSPDRSQTKEFGLSLP